MAEAEKIVSYLMKNRIIACANYFPIKNTYWWKGNMENGEEIVSIVKTKKENWEKLKTEVKKIHSYEVPCIIKLDVESTSEYEDWINSETN